MKVAFDIDEVTRIINSLSKKFAVLQSKNQAMETEISNLTVYWNSESGEVYRNKIIMLNCLIDSDLSECKLLIEILTNINNAYIQAKQILLEKAQKLRGV